MTLVKYLLLIKFFVVGITGSVDAQKLKTSWMQKKESRQGDYYKGLTFVANYSGFRQSILGAGIGYYEGAIPWGSYGPEFMVSTNFKRGNDYLMGYKIGGTLNIVFFGVQSYLALQTNYDTSQLFYQFQAGITASGVIFIGYGLNQPLGPNKFESLTQRHNIVFTARLFMDY